MTEADHPRPVRVLMLGPALNVQGGITTLVSLMLRHCPPEIEYRHVGTFGGESKLARAAWFLPAFPRAARWILSPRTDLVHIHFASWGSTARKLPLAALALAIGKPLVLHPNGAKFDQFYFRLPRHGRRMIARCFGRATKLIAVSESWMNFYAEHFALRPEQRVVMPNPVEIPPAVPDRAGRSEVMFLFLGRIGPRKGAFDVLSAVAELKESGMPFRVILAGDGQVEEARGRARELGVADRVTVESWVDAQRRGQLLEQADVFILPSYDEGLPLALMEALAAGLPAISTPVGGIPEVVRHGQEGLIVRPGDTHEIAVAMRSMCERPDERLAMGRAARRRVEPMAIELFMKQLTDVYRSAIAQHSTERRTGSIAAVRD